MLDESFPDHLLREKCTPIVINGLEPSTKNLSGSRQKHTTTTTTIWLSDLMSWHICVCVCVNRVCLCVMKTIIISNGQPCMHVYLFIYSSTIYRVSHIKWPESIINLVIIEILKWKKSWQLNLLVVDPSWLVKSQLNHSSGNHESL